MKIFIDCTYLRNRHTGVDEYFFGLIYDLLSIDTHNSYTIMVDTRYDISNLENQLIGKFNYSIKKIYSPLPLQVLYAAFIFPFYLLLNRYDVYHNPYMFGPLIRFVCFRTKIIITVHDLYHRTVPKKTNRMLNWVFRLCADVAIKKADRIIAISSQTQNDIFKYLQVPPYKVTLIYQALNSKMDISFNRDNTSNYDFYCKKYILTVGWVLPSKGLDDLVDAFLIMISKFNLTDICLVSVGSDKHPFASEIRSKIGAIDLRGNQFSMLGYVSTENLRRLYSEAAVVVIPSHYEGFGVPILEAMLFEKPLIVRNASSLVEVAGDAALFFSSNDELADKLHRLLFDHDLTKNLVRRGRENLLRFSGSMRAKKTLEVYCN